MKQAYEALRAILNGARTSAEIGQALDIKPKHAQVLTHNLMKARYIRWTGEMMPREPGRHGRSTRIYEIVS